MAAPDRIPRLAKCLRTADLSQTKPFRPALPRHEPTAEVGNAERARDRPPLGLRVLLRFIFFEIVRPSSGQSRAAETEIVGAGDRYRGDRLHGQSVWLVKR